MASLDKRIRAMELISVPVVSPRTLVTFVSPAHGVVGARLCGGNLLERQDDETEAEFLERVKRLEETYDPA